MYGNVPLNFVSHEEYWYYFYKIMGLIPKVMGAKKCKKNEPDQPKQFERSIFLYCLTIYILDLLQIISYYLRILVFRPSSSGRAI